MISREAIARLRALRAKRVMVQIPEGLKPAAGRIAAQLQSEGFLPIVGVEPCFGACDLADADAKALGCGAVLHIGHTDFGVKPKVPVVYDAWASGFDPVPVLRKNFGRIDKYKSFGLLASAQYLGSLEKAGRFLESRGKRALAGRAGALRPGQVLGCNYSAAVKVEKGAECFIFIGSGKFHYEGLLSVTGKPVFFVDAEGASFSEVPADSGKPEVKRRLRIEKARGLSRFAVFVSVKAGQQDTAAAVKVAKHLEERGKEAFLIAAGMLTPEKMAGMGIEVLVNTACPRMRDDRQLFGILILNADEALQL